MKFLMHFFPSFLNGRCAISGRQPVDISNFNAIVYQEFILFIKTVSYVKNPDKLVAADQEYC